MKKYVAVMWLMWMLFSCNTKKPAVKPEVKDSLIVTVKTDSAKVITDTHYFWSAELGPGGLVMVKTRPAVIDSLTATSVIAMLNSGYPEIPLRFTKISNDTLFVKIPKSDYLTRQMGTSGSEAYLAEATYNLTEIKDINFVDFKFKEGDHAQPGTFSRTDFIRPGN